jgi:hypothetical protein
MAEQSAPTANGQSNLLHMTSMMRGFGKDAKGMRAKMKGFGKGMREKMGNVDMGMGNMSMGLGGVGAGITKGIGMGIVSGMAKETKARDSERW